MGQPIEARHLLAHRAAYRLSLAPSRDGNLTSARGGMIYELVDACDGWATRQRFTLTLTDREGTEIETASDYSTVESKDGRHLRFTLTQMTQGAVTQRIAGEAELNPDGSGVVRYSEPEVKEERLPAGTMLPNRHTIIALNAARSGQRLVVGPLFDGTSDDGSQDTTTVLSAWDAARENAEFPLLSPLGSVRMRIAFFDREAQQQGGGATTPSYEVSLRYWENGVADQLLMDFREFAVDGRMVKLEPVPGGC
ncbi:cell envelope integrity EipB family protein [Roseomonas terrae]|uniref:Cell envelope integrity EipB family protein n=2 Tax=Neoroseomonas terrae TaxID=424799 RepID=A0ABS5EGZ3_9PROT|nr:cell envelope integrity EipB family protein [Neoroseomonas terrae]